MARLPPPSSTLRDRDRKVPAACLEETCQYHGAAQACMSPYCFLRTGCTGHCCRHAMSPAPVIPLVRCPVPPADRTRGIVAARACPFLHCVPHRRPQRMACVHVTPVCRHRLRRVHCLSAAAARRTNAALCHPPFIHSSNRRRRMKARGKREARRRLS